MTTEIEKQFFDTFGIEPKVISAPNYHWEDYILEYPQITDRILLNLILIMNPYAPPVGDTMEEMKEQVLYWCTQYAKKLKHQVQALFKENNNDR